MITVNGSGITSVSRLWGEAEDGEGSGHVTAGPSGGFGDVGASCQAERAVGEVAQGGQVAGACAGVCCGVVFAPEGVADPVQGLHGLVVLDVSGQRVGCG